MKEKLKVYFLGSGPIAVPVLKKLYESDELSLTGVGTQQDRPAGRKRLLTPTPAGGWCAGKNIVPDKPSSVNTPEFMEKIKNLNPDLILVVSFGQILKEDILSLPPLGCINIHASILPEHRGASPIAQVILNGGTETGVSFMRMDKGLDTGPVYRICPLPLDGTEKADSLEENLGKLASEFLEETLTGIASGRFPAEKQDSSKASYAGKISKDHGKIDWSEPAETIERKVRAFYPWPGVSFSIELPEKEMKIKITESEIVKGRQGLPGEVLEADKKNWIVACGKNSLRLAKVHPTGKKEMSGTDFLRGCPLKSGTILKNG